jgi:hypothetical protein
MAVANTLAHCITATNMAIRSFKVQALGAQHSSKLYPFYVVNNLSSYLKGSSLQKVGFNLD